MKSLELKIPPPVVALLVGGIMWMAKHAPFLAIPRNIVLLAAATLVLAGFAIAGAGLISFRRAGTTVHPHRPQETSALVTTGIYRYSRNPMYAGMLLIVVAWAVYLGSLWALAGPVVFVLYINRFQILPEERVLSAKFGETYAAYRSKVRPWL